MHVRGRRVLWLLAGGAGLVGLVAWLVYGMPGRQGRAAARAPATASARADAAARTTTPGPTAPRTPTRTDLAETPAGTTAVRDASPPTDPSVLMERLHECGQTLDALRADVRKRKDELKPLRQDKSAEEQRGRVESELAAVEARIEEVEKARRGVRTEFKRWLAGDPSRPAALYDAAAAGSPADRREAGRILAGFFDNAALESRVLRDLTAAPDEGVRGMALDVVTARPTERRLEGLRTMARKDGKDELRARAVEVLGRFQEDPLVIRRRSEIRGTLLEAASAGAAPAERREAILALGRIGSPEPEVRALAERMAKEDPDGGVRAVARHVVSNWQAYGTNGREE